MLKPKELQSVETSFPAIPPMPGYQKHESAETEPQRLRRECIAWIEDNKFKVTASTIMSHCFGVALELLNRNGETM